MLLPAQIVVAQGTIYANNDLMYHFLESIRFGEWHFNLTQGRWQSKVDSGDIFQNQNGSDSSLTISEQDSYFDIDRQNQAHGWVKSVFGMGRHVTAAAW